MPEGDVRTLINGCEGSCIEVGDRGFAYGDGLFETIAVIDGTPSLWQYHGQRLVEGCRRLVLPIPDSDVIESELSTLAAGNSGVAKLTVTRGIGPRGYAIPASPRPNRILQFHVKSSIVPAFREQGVAVRLCTTGLAINPLLAGIKHLNRLEQVLARGEWDDDCYVEGLMCSHDGDVIEGTCSNLFLLESGRLLTPKLDRCGIWGVMRACVIDAANGLGIEVKEVRISREQLLDADGLFLTNSLWGMVPVRSVDDKSICAGVMDRRLVDEVWKRAFGRRL